MILDIEPIKYHISWLYFPATIQSNLNCDTSQKAQYFKRIFCLLFPQFPYKFQ